MKSTRPTIVIVGSGLSLSMCAAYLVEKLHYLNPVCIGVCVPSREQEADLAFAFPPFSEPLAPILRSQMAEASLSNISILSPASPAGFAFNFGLYGVASGAITFPHAYEICRQHTANMPAYDSFLGVQPSPSPGILYSRQLLAPDFRQAAVRNKVPFVPTKIVNVTLADGGEKILAITTSNGQRITGDYFIDCSPDGVVMQHLQKRIPIEKNTVPSWNLVRRHEAAMGIKPSYQLKLDQTRVECVGEIGGKRYVNAYDFSGGIQSGEYFERPWLGNCITLGQGFLQLPELLIDLDRVLERQLTVLSWLLGVNGDTTYASQYFNRASMRQLNEAIDTVNLLLQVVGTNRPELTESNQHRVNLFRSSANTVKEDNLLISESGWTGLLHAVGFIPKSTNAVSMATDPKRIVELTKSLLMR